MRKQILTSVTGLCLLFGNIHAQQITDSLSHPVVQKLDEVVVTGTRNETDVRHLPMTISILSREKIAQAHQPSILSLLEEQIPGLFTTTRGMLGYGVSGGAAGQISLRGVGGPAQPGVPTTGLLVLIDGHPQYMGLFAHPISDAYQSFLTERVEVLRGASSVLYGSNAMGGVINIVTRKMQEDGVRTHLDVGYGSYNTLQTELTNRIHKGRFSSIIGLSYNRTDGHRSDMEFKQWSGYAKLGYDIAEHWKVQADLNLTRFNASNPGEESSPLIDNDQNVTRGMTSISLDNRYNKTSGSLSFFYNWGIHWINDGYSEGQEPLNYRFNSRDNMAGFSWFQSAQLFKGNRLTAGFDYFRFGGESWNRPLEGEERQMLVDKKLEEIAGYIDFRQALTEWLTADAGLRIDHHSHVGTEYVPQVGLSFHLANESELKGMASKGFRYPTIREMFMFRPANPNLVPEKLWNYELSYSQRLWGGDLSYGINIFYINGENLIMRIPVDGRQQNVNSGKIENSGGEIEATYRFSQACSINTNYSYLHMAQPVLASPEHKFYIGGNLREGRWTINPGLQYVAGLYTQVKVANSGTYTKENFTLLNLRLSYRVHPNIRLWIRGENLLAKKYEINHGFPMPRATVMGGVFVNI